MKFFFWLLVAGWSIWAAPYGVQAQSVPFTKLKALTVSEQQHRYDLGTYLQILEDKEANLSIEQVASIEYNSAFVESTEEQHNFGYTKSVYWARVLLNNRQEHEREYWLEIDYALLNYIDVYIVDANGQVEQRKAGNLLPFGAREVNYKNPIFKIDLPPSFLGNRLIYIRIESQSTMAFPMTLWAPDAFIDKSSDLQLGFGIYYGLMLVMIFYNLFIFFSLRDISYLYYVLNIAFIILFQATFNGLSFQYLWPELPGFNKFALTLFIAALTFSSLRFTSSFLNTKQNIPKRLHMLLFVGMGLALFELLIFPFLPYQIAIRIATATAFPFIFVVIGAAVIAFKRGYRPARFFLLAWGVFLLGAFFIILRAYGILPTNFITTYAIQIGSALEVLFLSLGLADRINTLRRELTEKALEKARSEKEREQKQKEFIAEQNKELEKQVEERTRELAEQNRQIMASIRYAERIQRAILPPKNTILQALPESFIYFKPRDIVSGDFYWFTQQDDKIIIAAVDCTGHGVPGAFMSMVGNTLLNQIVIERGITRPAEILNQLHHEIRTALKQEEDGYSRDGMDIALCTIHQDVNILEFAGANRPLFLLKNKELMEVSGDKMSIGGVRRHTERQFQNHIIKLEEGEESTIYLSSDGYADQFGGAQNRKFMVRNFKRLLVELGQQKSLKSQHLTLNKVLEEWRGEQRQIDDILVIGFKLKTKSKENTEFSA